jgi:hypothetical protein
MDEKAELGLGELFVEIVSSLVFPVVNLVTLLFDIQLLLRYT